MEAAQNYLKICAKPILSVLITNMDENFENVVTKEDPTGTKNGTNDQLLKLYGIISKFVQNLLQVCCLSVWMKILKILSLKWSK